MSDHRSPPARRVAGVWLVRNGRILVLQRVGGQSDGAWVPPGGNVDAGEEPLAAAVRETLEETGLTLSDPEFLRSWVWDGGQPIEVHHFVGFAEGELVQISHEHYDFDWFTPADYAARHLPNGAAGRVGQWVAEMRVSAAMVEGWMRSDSPDA